jgi:hypothetical protein
MTRDPAGSSNLLSLAGVDVIGKAISTVVWHVAAIKME